MSDVHDSTGQAAHQEHGSGDGAEHGGHAGKHRGGHAKHGDSHGAGGHGGSWIVTYCDMITLLIAFFICILTFASKESGKGDHRKLHDSVLYGPGGTGIVGGPSKSNNHDGVVWRQALVSANLEPKGAPIPPLYSDPALDVTARVLAMLEQPGEGTLAESYSATIPGAVLFDGNQALTATGKQLFSSVANNLGALPFDVVIHVDRQAHLARAAKIAQFLIREQGWPASRVGIGLSGVVTAPTDGVRLLFVKRPKEPAR